MSQHHQAMPQLQQQQQPQQQQQEQEAQPAVLSTEDVLAPITPETLAALMERDREIAVLKQRAARMAELVESSMRACEAFGRDVLLADNELIVYLEREVDLRKNGARATCCGCGKTRTVGTFGCTHHAPARQTTL